MTCYLCGSGMSHFLHKNGYDIYRCSACGLARTQLKEDYKTFLKNHYSRGYYTGDPSYSAYVSYKDDKPHIVRNMRKFLKSIQKEKPGGRLLDVGCAMGYFVELALAAGYDAYGFDPSSYAVAHAKKTLVNGRVQVGDVSSVSYPPKSFDVITMFDVFEHLDDPAAALVRVREWLADDGVVVIATGDTQSAAARVLGRRWTFYIPPQHLFFFNRKNLSLLFSRLGFVPLGWTRTGKWLSLRYILHLARTTGESIIAKWLYELVRAAHVGHLPLYIPMRDNIIVTVRKKKQP